MSQHGFVLRNLTGPYTSFEDADHMWTFIAFVKGNQLPAYARDLYPLAGTIDSLDAGPLAGQSGFSSIYTDSSKEYEVRFQTSDSILFSTVGLYLNESAYANIVMQLGKSNTNKIRYYHVLGYKALRYLPGGAFIAIAEHDARQLRPEIGNIRVISGVINADGTVRSGNGFSVSKSGALFTVNFDQAVKILAFDLDLVGDDGSNIGAWLGKRRINESPTYEFWEIISPVVFTAVVEVSN